MSPPDRRLRTRSYGCLPLALQSPGHGAVWIGWRNDFDESAIGQVKECLLDAERVGLIGAVEGESQTVTIGLYPFLQISNTYHQVIESGQCHAFIPFSLTFPANGGAPKRAVPQPVPGLRSPRCNRTPAWIPSAGGAIVADVTTSAVRGTTPGRIATTHAKPCREPVRARRQPSVVDVPAAAMGCAKARYNSVSRPRWRGLTTLREGVRARQSRAGARDMPKSLLCRVLPTLLALSFAAFGHAAEKLTAAPAVKKAAPAVVNISVFGQQRSRGSQAFEFFQFPVPDRSPVEPAPGTGPGSSSMRARVTWSPTIT